MKYILLSLILISFQKVGLCQNNIALVNKLQGLYIFNDCLPTNEYEIIGEISTDGFSDKEIINSKGQYAPVRDFLIKTARQVNYLADGLILSLVNGGSDKATIIKFKEVNPNNNRAKVNQYQGVLVFIDNEPLTTHEYINTVKIKGNLSSNQYTSVRDKLLERCKIDFADARAIILKFINGGNDTGEIIRFTK